jgi:hypothetical protein
VTVGTLVILGSGEIAPSMVKVYRSLLENRERRGVLLDTPYGFQENVPQLTQKIIEYFATSLQVTMTTASLLRLDQVNALDRARYLETIKNSPFVFAGPGSPSYALRQWQPLQLADALSEVLARDGLVCFSSAAALTLGRRTAPIYELYKVGDDPYWLDGLNLMGTLGINCAVVPHFDNAEGGNHDTRFCYLGERRLDALHAQLTDGEGILGIDEHTAVVCNLADDVLTVHGRGKAYWRTGDGVTTFETGDSVPLDTLRAESASVRAPVVSAPLSDDSLAARALAGGADGAAAIAELERRASEGGHGRIDPTNLVEGILAARAAARANGAYELADSLRDLLVNSGIEVQDTPSGATWSLRN